LFAPNEARHQKLFDHDQVLDIGVVKVVIGIFFVIVMVVGTFTIDVLNMVVVA
jgi:hypothetical protein